MAIRTGEVMLYEVHIESCESQTDKDRPVQVQVKRQSGRQSSVSFGPAQTNPNQPRPSHSRPGKAQSSPAQPNSAQLIPMPVSRTGPSPAETGTRPNLAASVRPRPTSDPDLASLAHSKSRLKQCQVKT